MKTSVLILCTANSARSQMAEGLLRHYYGKDFEVESAGTRATHVRPEAIQVMNELGIDISSHRSKTVDEFANRTFDHVLTVCDNAKESCPIYPGHANRLHHNFEDPAVVQGSEEERLTAFRKVRDEIRAYLKDFTAQADRRAMRLIEEAGGVA
jgi:arsenate reductase